MKDIEVNGAHITDESAEILTQWQTKTAQLFCQKSGTICGTSLMDTAAYLTQRLRFRFLCHSLLYRWLR